MPKRDTVNVAHTLLYFMTSVMFLTGGYFTSVETVCVFVGKAAASHSLSFVLVFYISRLGIQSGFALNVMSVSRLIPNTARYPAPSIPFLIPTSSQEVRYSLCSPLQTSLG